MLLLKHVFLILKYTQQISTKARQDRKHPIQVRVGEAGEMRKIHPEKEQIHLLNLGDGTGNIRPRHLKGGKSPQRLRILDQLDHLQLRRGTQFHPSQLRCLCHKGGNDLRIHVQQMLQRIVHHRNQAENDGDLDQHGDHPHHRTVVFALVKRHLLLRRLILVSHMAGHDLVDLRLELHHLDGVFLHPDIDGEQNHLGQNGKKYDRQPIIFTDPIAHPHQIPQRRSDDGIDKFQARPSSSYIYFSKT